MKKMVMISLTFAAVLPLCEFAQTNVTARLANADPAVCLSRFVGYPDDAAKGVFRPNERFWLKGVDFSCVSPWNNGGRNTRAGTAISKRHIVFAKHFPLWKGVRILFVGEDGGVCPCYVEATKAIEKSDIMIGLLNAELTPNIRPARLLPDNMGEYLGHAAGLPIVTFDQNERVLLSESNPIKTNSVVRFVMQSRWPRDKKLVPFKSNMIVGDSGNPAFLLIGNEPILLYCLHRGGSGQGPALHLYKREIQAAMDELCPGYKLEVFDFSRVKNEK